MQWRRAILVCAVLLLAAIAIWMPRIESFSWFHAQFASIAAGMSETQVLALLGSTQNQKPRWPPQVSTYADAWRQEGAAFVRHEYWGQDVHTRVLLSSRRYRVWQNEEAVVIVEFDKAGRVCAKTWLTESPPKRP